MRDTPLFSPHWAQVGYLDLVPAATARYGLKWVPLSHYPIFVTLIALLAHLIPVVWIATSRAPLFDRPTLRLLSMSAFVFAIPIEAIWLSTLASKFILACVPVLVLLEGKHLMRRWGASCLMFLASMGSVVACFLTPLVMWFIMKPGEGRSRAPLVAFLCGAAVQGVMMMNGSADEGSGWSPAARVEGDASVVGVLATLVQAVLHPLGLLPKSGQGEDLWLTLTGQFQIPPWLLMGALTVVLIAALSWIVRGPQAKLLMGGFVLILAGSWVGALGEKNMLPERYLITPSIFLYLAAVASLDARPFRRLPFFAALALVATMTLVGIGRWLHAVAADPQRPIWAEEVARYESGESPFICVTPAGFVMRPVKSSGNVEYRSEGSGHQLHLVVERPKLGAPLTVAVHGGVYGAKGALSLEPGRAPIERSRGSSNEREGASAPVGGMMLPNRSEGPGLVIPFMFDERGVGRIELKLADDPLYVGRTYSMQGRVDGATPAFTEVVTLRLGK